MFKSGRLVYVIANLNSNVRLGFSQRIYQVPCAGPCQITVYEVGDVGGRASPLGDGLARGRGGELGNGGTCDLHPGVKGWQRSVDELRVALQQLLGVWK